MSYNPQRFRNIAAQTQTSDLAVPELRVEKVIPLVATHLTRRFLDAVASGLDLNNPLTVWSLLHIDLNFHYVNDYIIRRTAIYYPFGDRPFG